MVIGILELPQNASPRLYKTYNKIKTIKKSKRRSFFGLSMLYNFLGDLYESSTDVMKFDVFFAIGVY